MFSGHLNGHNNDFLVLCDAYVYAVPLLVRTINFMNIIVRFYYIIIVLVDI